MLIALKQESTAKGVLGILVVLISFFVSACGGDSVIFYKPKDWIKVENPWYMKSFEDVDLKVNEIGGITMNDRLIPEVMIHNRAKLTAVLEGVILKADGKEYSAHPFGKTPWEAVPSNETRRLELEFEFNKSIGEVLKNSVELTLLLRIGSDSNRISIPMIKRE